MVSVLIRVIQPPPEAQASVTQLVEPVGHGFPGRFLCNAFYTELTILGVNRATTSELLPAYVWLENVVQLSE